MSYPKTPPTPPGRDNDTLDLYEHRVGMSIRRRNDFHRKVRDFLVVNGHPTPALGHTMATMLEWLEAMSAEEFERFAMKVLAKRLADDARRHRRVRGLKNTYRDLGR